VGCYTVGIMLDGLGGENFIVDVIVVVVCLLVSMTVHEFMHAYVGFRLGDTTAMERGRVSFNPLHHIDPLMTVLLPAVTLLLFHAPILAAKPVPFNPDRLKYGEYGAALLAFAGPASNLVLAFLGALLLRFFDLGSFVEQSVVFLVELNVALAVFNLVPIPPLDGSRVLYAFAPEIVQDFMQRVEPYGFFIIIVLVLWGGASNVLGYFDTFVLNLLP
jgi:Zn-dependent protease